MFGWFKKADSGSGSSGGTSSSDPSKAEIDKVAEYLSRYQTVCEGERRITLPRDSALAQAARERLESSGQLAASTEYHSKRSREIEELMELYGEAVRRVPGADPQDLHFLATMGMIERPTH